MLKKQNGSALFVSLIMLSLLMILGTSTLTTSMVDLKIAGNTRLSMDSLQKADAGISGTVSLIGTADDPFNGNDNPNPFATLANAVDPLQPIENEVAVFTTLVAPEGACGRSTRGSSSGTISCEYYQINSTHVALNNVGVSKTVIQGVRREIIGN